jgi:putative ABC transport system permease protein
MGIYHDVHDQCPNVGIEPNAIGSVWPDWHVSKETEAALNRERIAALVGLDTMRRFNFQLGQRITLKGTVYPVELTVKSVGTLGKGTMPSMLLLRRDYMQESTGRSGGVDVMWVKVDRRESIGKIIEQIDSTFANSAAPTQTETEEAFQAGALQQFETIIYLMETFAAVILLSITLVAANTAAMSIRERRHEVAVMRSIGFSSRSASSLLTCENVMLSAVSGLIGIGIAELSVRVEGPRILGGVGLVWLPPLFVAYAMGVAISIGALSAIVPAIGIARRNIVDELRTVA